VLDIAPGAVGLRENGIMPEEVLTVQEVAAMLRTTPATVYSWCRAGKLPAFKIGQQWRIRARALEGIMEQGGLPDDSARNGGAKGPNR
jgi:excisionase family DNA binding protein